MSQENNNGCSVSLGNGCGCLALSAGMYFVYKVVTTVASKVHNIVSNIPGEYITVIGVPVTAFLIKKQLQKFQERRARSKTEKMRQEARNCLEVIEPPPERGTSLKRLKGKKVVEADFKMGGNS